MKLRYLVLIVVFFSPFVTFTCAQEQKIDVELDIFTYEINDAYVVGDFFYYEINFTNTGTEIIDDTFTISVFDPSGNIMDIPMNYEILIEPNGSYEITAKGGKENETAIFPFDTAGDYKIEINSTKSIDFYRWIFYNTTYIRQNKNFKYFFDVMPQWQYMLWKNTELANQKTIEANQRLINLSSDLNTATWIIVTASVLMVVIAYKTYKISKKR